MLKAYRLQLKGRSGQSITLVAIAIAVMLGFAALVVDIGYMSYQKSYLENAADASALAGAANFSRNDSVIRSVVTEYVDKNTSEGSATLNTLDINRDDGTVTVLLSQKAPKFFAGILTSDEHLIKAKAKAKAYAPWSGSALPFINLDDPYSTDPASPDNKLKLWEKLGMGDFESIWKDDFTYPDDVDYMYFEVFWQDGITVKKGKVANVKQEVQQVYDQGKDVYAFSLSNDAIARYAGRKMSNQEVIPVSDLVLLKITITAHDYNAKVLDLTVKEVYDLANGEFPQDDFSGQSKITAKLISY